MVTAAEEFKKNSDLKEEDLKHVKDWISKQPHLPQNITDEKIIILMHSCYYNIEQSKQFIDTYYTLRTHLPEFFTKRELSKELMESYKTCNIIPLDGRTKEGYKILYCSLMRTEPQFFNHADTFKLINMVADAAIEETGTAPGVILIMDLSGLKLGHLARISLPVTKKSLMYLQEGSPVRLKGYHYVNAVPFVDKLLAIMRPFMSKELMDMLVLHYEGSDTIYDVVPKDVLPNECGGSGGTIEELREKSYKLIQNYQGWYKEDELMRVDEAKRPGKAKSAGDLFGLDGSFRKLDLD